MSADRSTSSTHLLGIALILGCLALNLLASSTWAVEARDLKAEDEARQAELEIIAQSLSPSGRQMLKRKLKDMPLYRVELELDPKTRFLRGKIQILVPQNATPQSSNQGVFLRTKAAERPEAELVFGRVTVDEQAVDIQEISPGVHFVPFEPSSQNTSNNPATEADQKKPKSKRPRVRKAPFKEVYAAFSLNLIPRSWTTESELNDAEILKVLLGGTDGEDENSPKRATQKAKAGAGSEADDKSSPPLRRDGDAFLLAGVFPQIALPDAQGLVHASDPSFGESLWNPLTANYIVAIVAPKDHIEAGTGLRIGSVPEENERTRTTRVAAATREFSLIVGRNFFESTREQNGILVREIHHFGYDMEAMGISKAVIKALDYFSRELGPYPWSSFDIALMALDGGQPKDVFPTALYWSPGINTDDFTKAFHALLPGGMGVMSPPKAREEEVAHLVAHQWFRGILGSDGLNDPAMDEAFSLQAACSLMEATRGKMAGKQCRDRHIEGSYRQYRMHGGQDFPLNTSMNAFERNSQFNAISGAKGAFFLDKLRTAVGPVTYQSALRNFLRRRAFTTSSFREITQTISANIPAKRQPAHRAMAHRFLTQTTADKDIGPAYTPQDFTNRNMGSPALNAIVADAVNLLFSQRDKAKPKSASATKASPSESDTADK